MMIISAQGTLIGYTEEQEKRLFRLVFLNDYRILLCDGDPSGSCWLEGCSVVKRTYRVKRYIERLSEGDLSWDRATKVFCSCTVNRLYTMRGPRIVVHPDYSATNRNS
jgi:hypothetical protein